MNVGHFPAMSSPSTAWRKCTPVRAIGTRCWSWAVSPFFTWKKFWPPFTAAYFVIRGGKWTFKTQKLTPSFQGVLENFRRFLGIKLTSIYRRVLEIFGRFFYLDPVPGALQRRLPRRGGPAGWKKSANIKSWFATSTSSLWTRRPKSSIK